MAPKQQSSSTNIFSSSSFLQLQSAFHSSYRFGYFLILASDDYSMATRDHFFYILSGSGSGGGGGGDWSTAETKRLGMLPAMSSLPHCFIGKEFIGSCNGLICVLDRISQNIYLWNPATGKSRKIDKPNNLYEDESQSPRDIMVGFGSDGVDHKVVLFTGFRSMFYKRGERKDFLCIVQVYSVGTNSWTFLEEQIEGAYAYIPLPGDPFSYRSNQGIYLNHTFFFMAKFIFTLEEMKQGIDSDDRLIISYDFTTKAITSIPLPTHLSNQKLYLSSLGDKLALFTKAYQAVTGKAYTHAEDFDIWVKDGESWTKKDSFQIAFVNGECNDPIGLSNDGETVFLETTGSTTGLCDRIRLYHLITKEVKKSMLPCSALMSKAIPYHPTLENIFSRRR